MPPVPIDRFIALPPLPLHLIPSIVLAMVSGAGVHAAEEDLRLVPQVLAGTAGVEPGLALEWRSPDLAFIIRPEVLLSEDGRPGGGGAVLIDLSPELSLPSGQAFAIGPRAVYHNADDSGWEVDAMATWAYEIARGHLAPWRHAIGAIGALGVLHDKKHDETAVGASGGLFYSYRF